MPKRDQHFGFGPKLTYAPQQTAFLFDHLVGAHEERLGIVDPEGFRGPEADNHLESRWSPLDLRARIGADVVAAASDPTIGERIAASGQLMRTGGPAELASALEQQAATAAGVAKILGMEMKK